MNTLPPRNEACASRLALDRYLAGELEAARAAQLESHAEQCTRCRLLLDEQRRAAAAFSPQLPAAVAERVRDRARGRALPRPARQPWAAAAAGMAVLWLAIVSRQPAAEVGEREKGGMRVTFYVLHDGKVRPGIDGERLHPGDAIEFAYTSERDAYLAIVSIDGERKASAYYDSSGHAAAIRPAHRALLDRSTVLDAALGRELVYALFCARPIAVDPLLRALEADPERPLAVADCAIERLELFKVAR